MRREAICAYAQHRISDWSHEDGPAWVCGVCHPPPGIPVSVLSSRQEGYLDGKRSFHAVVRRDPAEVVAVPSAPARSVPAPTRGAQYVQLRRPVTRAEADQFGAEMRKALEFLGVERGESFVVMKAPANGKPLGEIGAAYARTNDPGTSKAAAQKKLPRAGTDSDKVLKALAENLSGLTPEEASEITGIAYRSITPRFGALKRAGWTVANGMTRKTTTGADSEVIVLTREARVAMGLDPAPPALQGDQGALIDNEHRPGSALLQED